MEHRRAPLPTKAIAFQFCFYYILILRNCQSIHIYRTVQRDRQIGQRERMVTTALLKIINDLANDAVIRDGPQRNHAILVLVSIGRIRRWTPNIKNVEISVIVDCYIRCIWGLFLHQSHLQLFCSGTGNNLFSIYNPGRVQEAIINFLDPTAPRLPINIWWRARELPN